MRSNGGIIGAKKTVSPSARKAIIINSTAERQSMKAANPFLDAIITGGGFEIASETIMFEALEQMVQDASFNISESVKLPSCHGPLTFGAG